MIVPRGTPWRCSTSATSASMRFLDFSNFWRVSRCSGVSCSCGILLIATSLSGIYVLSPTSQGSGRRTLAAVAPSSPANFLVSLRMVRSLSVLLFLESKHFQLHCLYLRHSSIASRRDSRIGYAGVRGLERVPRPHVPVEIQRPTAPFRGGYVAVQRRRLSDYPDRALVIRDHLRPCEARAGG